jgi:Ca2+/Na+ antiporter
MGSAIIWLAILAEGMMRGADASGCILGISEDLMGLTITAVGTSLPNLFASIFVARQGLGNMSVSIAFGSNTFNIFIALALPWLVGAILAGHNDTCGSGYAYPVERGKIFTSCLILAGVLLMVVSVLIMTKMMLTKTIGYFFNVAYIAILGYLIIS